MVFVLGEFFRGGEDQIAVGSEVAVACLGLVA